MNYTDKYYFTFPMKVYDGFSLRRAMKREEDTDTPTDGDWVEGKISLPGDEIDGWFDVFSKGRTVDDVIEDGFDGLIVLTRTKGEFECTWTRERFEREYNAFREQYNAHLKDDLGDIMRDFKDTE